MVSFVCGRCQDVVKKTKTAKHTTECHTSFFTCVDCNAEFDQRAVAAHSQCLSGKNAYSSGRQRPFNDLPPFTILCDRDLHSFIIRERNVTISVYVSSFRSSKIPRESSTELSNIQASSRSDWRVGSQQQESQACEDSRNKTSHRHNQC